VETVPPPELKLNARALVVLLVVLPEADPDAVAIPNAEEPLALEALADAAIASPALNTRPSNRQGNTKLFKTFTDTPLWD